MQATTETVWTMSIGAVVCSPLTWQCQLQWWRCDGTLAPSVAPPGWAMTKAVRTSPFAL
jgi:hypothetical protein